jgi:protoporphyrin/coproporphyrin ferrochelatase
MSAAVLLVSHGSVDSIDDLPTFVTNVRRGRPPPPELLQELRHRYEVIGGRSPLNAVNAEVARKLEASLGVAVAWANRLFEPYVGDVVRRLAEKGTTRVALLPLAQHSAHVYAANARDAVEANAGGRMTLACAENWGRDPGLCAAFGRRIAATVRAATEGAAPVGVRVVMTAHSLPRSVVDAGDPYAREVEASAVAIDQVVRGVEGCDVPWSLAFQSQGMGGTPGRPSNEPAWLGPDIASVLDECRARADRHVVFAPIGFLADHVEILYDLDVEARRMAGERGLGYSRAPSLNADDDLVAVLARIARSLLDA